MHTLQLQIGDDTPAPVRLGSFEVSVTSEPYIIAEVGVNHDGSVEQAKRLIDAASRAQAQAVKFQVFRADALVRRDAPAAGYQRSGGFDSPREMLQALELEPEHFQQLSAYCKSCGLDFLATPFSPADLMLLLDLQVPAVKIASTDLNNVPLLDAVIACGRPLLLSTGASEIAEIDAAVSQVDQQEACDRLILLHCVSSYPTAVQDASLSTIGLLHHRYNLWAGFSDHTASCTAAGLAVACGAKVLEKHLTLDRGLKGPDHAFSLTPEMFAEYVAGARQAFAMLGEPRQTILDAEQEVRAVSRRSIVARVPIPRGQVIREDMLDLKRPAGGLEPGAWDQIIGKTAAADIAADTPLSWDLVR